MTNLMKSDHCCVFWNCSGLVVLSWGICFLDCVHWILSSAWGMHLTDNNKIGSNVWFGGLDTAHKRWKNLSTLGKENFEKSILPSKIKWRMEDPHQSRVDGSV